MGPALLALLLSAQTASPTEPVPPPKPMLICRKVEQQTGSHIRTGRKCKSQEEWAREDTERERMSASTRITEGQGDALTKAATPH